MSTGSRLALAALSLALLGVPLGSAAGAGLAPPGGPGTAPQVTDGDTPMAANSSMVVRLRANGDARWAVSTTYTLTTPNETAAYRQLAADFQAGRTSQLGRPAFEWAIEEARRATGREMTLEDFKRRTANESTVVNGTGRLTLSFTWTDFGRTPDGELHVGDAFNTTEGRWLDGLAPNQRLVVEPPVGYGVVTADIPPRGGTLVWEGPTSFEPGALSAVFTGEAGPATTTTPPPGTDEPSGGLSPVAVGLAGALVVLALAVAVVVRQREAGGDGEGGAAAAEAEPTDGPDAPPEAAPETEPDPATAEEAAAAEDGLDEELLSDEERVERLIEANGGRMKQASIVKETGWSNAKVSQLLSAMEEEGRIDKLRIGRENLISFPDEDVTDAGGE